MKAETIVLSSFYQTHVSSDKRNPGFGLDITEHTDIDTTYGTKVDFDRLLEKAHDAGRFNIHYHMRFIDMTT